MTRIGDAARPASRAPRSVSRFLFPNPPSLSLSDAAGRAVLLLTFMFLFMITDEGTHLESAPMTCHLWFVISAHSLPPLLASGAHSIGDRLPYSFRMVVCSLLDLTLIVR